jgi:hypothetical protein
MRKLILLSMLLIGCISLAQAEETIANYDETNIATLNDELSRINRKKATKQYVDSKFPVNLTNNVTGALPIANGGTGQVTAQAAIDALLPAQTTANGKYLTSNGTNSSWGAVNSAGYSNVLFQWNGMEDGVANESNILITSHLSDAIGGTSLFLYLVVHKTTARTVLRGKFVKTSGVSTVTVNSRIWTNVGVGGSEAYIVVDVGGVNDSANRIGTTPAWSTPFTLNVSGLTNGTTYDITISLYNPGGGSANSYCSAVVLTGS